MLAFHAVCAKAARMSGAAEYVGKYDWDAENSSVLAEDGPPAKLCLEIINHLAIKSY